MVRINKSQLSEEQLAALFNQLSGTFGKLNANETELILSELLGPEEKIMLAKRLAIILLILEGNSLYKISKILRVSPTTAEKMKTGLDTGKFDELVKVLGKNEKDYFKILNALDNILHLGGILPHYNGIKRRKFQN